MFANQFIKYGVKGKNTWCSTLSARECIGVHYSECPLKEVLLYYPGCEINGCYIAKCN